MAPAGITLVFADDHELFREGLTTIIRKIKDPPIHLVGIAPDGKELVQLCHQWSPDLVLTDIQMPQLDGIEATRAIKKILPKTGVIALSSFNEQSLVLEMIEAGASGYLLKNTSREELALAIRKVYEGGYYFCPETMGYLAIAVKRYDVYQLLQKSKLTDREVEILRYICKGYPSKQIAARLKLSVRTIDSHRDRIYEKTGVHNVADLVIYSLKHHYIDIKDL